MNWRKDLEISMRENMSFDNQDFIDNFMECQLDRYENDIKELNNQMKKRESCYKCKHYKLMLGYCIKGDKCKNLDLWEII